MAITDYNSLADQVQKYLNRNDPSTVAQISQFIHVGEQNLYRDIRVPTMEADALFYVGYDSQTDTTYDSFQVPGNYLETRAVTIPQNNVVVRPVAYAEFTRKKNDIAGLPDMYARNANSIIFNRVPADLTQVQFLYYRSFDNLAPDNDPASLESPLALLRVCSDAFLYGALVEASTYLGDDRLQYFLSRYDGAVQALQRNADDLELSGTPLQVSISSDDYYYGPGSGAVS